MRCFSYSKHGESGCKILPTIPSGGQVPAIKGHNYRNTHTKKTRNQKLCTINTKTLINAHKSPSFCLCLSLPNSSSSSQPLAWDICFAASLNAVGCECECMCARYEREKQSILLTILGATKTWLLPKVILGCAISTHKCHYMSSILKKRLKFQNHCQRFKAFLIILGKFTIHVDKWSSTYYLWLLVFQGLS